MSECETITKDSWSNIGNGLMLSGTMSYTMVGNVDNFIMKELTPKHITFHGKTTIVKWKDETKTVVHCREDEEFHKENGFAAALTKKIFGSRSSFLNVVERNSVVKDYFTKEERKEKKRLKREKIEEKEKAEAEVLEALEMLESLEEGN